MHILVGFFHFASDKIESMQRRAPDLLKQMQISPLPFLFSRSGYYRLRVRYNCIRGIQNSSVHNVISAFFAFVVNTLKYICRHNLIETFRRFTEIKCIFLALLTCRPGSRERKRATGKIKKKERVAEI